MITIFNRKEVFITFNMNEMVRIKNILKDKNIEHYVKVAGRDFWSRGRTGSFGIDQSCNYEYKFYVKRSDYDSAIRYINEKR